MSVKGWLPISKQNSSLSHRDILRLEGNHSKDDGDEDEDTQGILVGAMFSESCLSL